MATQNTLVIKQARQCIRTTVLLQKAKTPKGWDGYSGKTTTCGTVTCGFWTTDAEKKSNTLPQNQKKNKGNKQKIKNGIEMF